MRGADAAKVLEDVQGSGPWTSRCPAHDDTRRSLSFRDDGDMLLVNCFAGCPGGNVLAALREKAGTPTNGNGNGKRLVATYTYCDESGAPVFYRDRFEWFANGQREKAVYPRTLAGEKKGTPPVIYRLNEVRRAVTDGAVVILCEGEKPADALVANGFVATTTGAAKSWKSQYAPQLQDARIVLWPDADGPGEQYIASVAADIRVVAAEVRVLRFEGKPKGWDAADFFAEGGSVEQLDSLLADAPDFTPDLPTAAAPNTTRAPATLDEAVATFRKWLDMPDDTSLYAMMGTVAANYLPGDAVWLGLVSPASSGKTEQLNALSGLPNVHHAATITAPALLSGTPKRDKAADAKGGLLRQVGDFGIIVMKDFGSVLSMRPDAKAEILAALREVYDGSWTRHLGTDGGKTLTWSGKVGVIFGCTPAIDSHHAVISSMGERFLLCRIPPAGTEQAHRALNHSGADTAIMRKELAEIVAAVFAGARSDPRPLSESDKQELVNMASRAVRLRSTVERDRQSREIESVHGAEGPARMVLTLERLLAGLDTIGCEQGKAMEVVRRVAMDSVPPLRRRALEFVEAAGVPVETQAVATALDLPTNTVRRVLEDISAYGLVSRRSAGKGRSDQWEAR